MIRLVFADDESKAWPFKFAQIKLAAKRAALVADETGRSIEARRDGYIIGIYHPATKEVAA